MNIKKPLVILPLYITWILLVGAFIIGLINTQWLTVAVAFMTLALTFVPVFFHKKSIIYIPPTFITLIAFFLYASLFLGEIAGFYQKIWWWDLAIHSGSALGFGLISTIVLLILFGKERNRAHSIIFALLSFCVAMTIGTMWEIFEFWMDQFFGLNMQKSGLFDTMGDLMVNAVGASIASLGGYLYVMQANYNPFKGIIEDGYIVNKTLAKHKRKIRDEKEIKDTSEK